MLLIVNGKGSELRALGQADGNVRCSTHSCRVRAVWKQASLSVLHKKPAACLLLTGAALTLSMGYSLFSFREEKTTLGWGEFVS